MKTPVITLSIARSARALYLLRARMATMTLRGKNAMALDILLAGLTAADQLRAMETFEARVTELNQADYFGATA